MTKEPKHSARIVKVRYNDEFPQPNHAVSIIGKGWDDGGPYFDVLLVVWDGERPKVA